MTLRAYWSRIQCMPAIERRKRTPLRKCVNPDDIPDLLYYETKLKAPRVPMWNAVEWRIKLLQFILQRLRMMQGQRDSWLSDTRTFGRKPGFLMDAMRIFWGDDVCTDIVMGHKNRIAPCYDYFVSSVETALDAATSKRVSGSRAVMTFGGVPISTFSGGKP